MTQIEHINPDGVFSMPIFTQLVTVTDAKLLYLAGQVAWDENGNIVGEGDLHAQAMQVFKNIQTILASVGADFTHVLKFTTYIVNYQPADREIYVDVLGQFVTLGDNPPANTLLGVQSLARPELLIEIDVVAAISPQ